MITIYKKKCGCIFQLVYLDKGNNYGRITYTVLCKAEEKEKEVAKKLFGDRVYNNIEIKYSDLDDAIRRSEVMVDVIETIKTLEDK